MTVGAVVVLVVLVLGLTVGQGSGSGPPPTTTPARGGAASPLSASWTGDGQPVTLAFGGDVHFEGPLGSDLSSDPATTLKGVSSLMAGSTLSMVSLDSALTDDDCAHALAKPYVFSAPFSAITALHDAGIDVVSQANNHAMDCGPDGVSSSLSAAAGAQVHVVGIGSALAAADAPYRTTIDGERIAILASSQLFDPGESSTTEAGATTAGVASAEPPAGLLAAVEAARRTADTVVVYVEWGGDGRTCPGPAQTELANALVRAGADIVVGSGSHVQMGAGFAGRALVDYGLGNLAFYNSTPPESDSGTLVVTITGRRVDRMAWRPAVLGDGQPTAQTGAAATAALARWAGLRGCAGLSAGPSRPESTPSTERTVPSPPTTAAVAPTGGTTSTTATGHPTSSTTTAPSASPVPTDNAGQPLSPPSTAAPPTTSSP